MAKKLAKIKVIVMLILMNFWLFAGCNPEELSNINARAMLSKNVLELSVLGMQPNTPGQYYIEIYRDDDGRDVFKNQFGRIALGRARGEKNIYLERQ